MIIGITGGTGCGKTTLLRQIEAMGGLILDCGAIYHQLLETDKNLLSALDARFPGTVAQGRLDRKKLGSIVFADPSALLDLNRITHAAVKGKVLQALETAPKLAAIDAIALHEGGLAELCDVTVAVTAPENMRIARLMQREGISEDYAKARIHAQHDDGWYREKCSHTLENTGNLSEFAGKCLAFLGSLGIMKENR